MEWNTMEEYLIQIGADIDQDSFSAADKRLAGLEGSLKKIEKYTAFTAFVQGAQALLKIAKPVADAFLKIGHAAFDSVVGVAKADMEYTKLAASMWTTKETAKALSVAMKTMGVSQEDLAWVPELREQFFRLREEINRFATPEDADAQLRYIREIGYDIQTLFVRLKMLKEWIAYYLIRYLEPYIKDFKAFINWLLDKLGEDLPGLARKVARAMSTVLSPVLATIKVLGMAIGKVYDFIVSLPDNVKKWGAIFAVVGAVIMSGPFGLLIAGLTAAMLLLEDFVGYMNGWDSSADLAPIWEALLAFKDGTGSDWLNDFKTKLSEIADILDHIVNELQLEEVFRSIKTAAEELGKGLSDLWKEQKKELEEFLKKLGIGLPQVKTFFGTIANGISEAIKTLANFAKLVGRVLQAASLIKEGKFSEAAGLFKDSVLEFGESVLDSNKKFYGKALKNLKEWHRDSTSENGGGGSFESSPWDRVKGFFKDTLGIGGGNGSGNAVVENASQFERGYQWMDPTGANTDPRNQCASFASQMMAGSGVDVDVTMNGDDLASQFKQEGAYHRVGDGYQPQPGDLIDWANHVGIYAGNGEYIARNSSGGVIRGSMEGMEQYFGSLWGFGSVSELQAAKHQNEQDGVDDANAYAMAQDVSGDTSAPAPAAGFMSGSNEMAMSPLDGIFKALQRPTEFKPNIQIPQMGMPDINIPEMRMPPFPDVKIPDIRIPDINIPQMQIPKFDIPVMTVADNSYAAGRDETPILPQAGGGTSNSYAIDMGTPVININVAGSNASPKEIAGAVKDGMTGWLDSALMNIQARNMRRPVV